ncbi:MAG: cytochrome c biogenesis protein CcdA [Chloroflexota bacterium]|nr:cytochrome c biogenesis protein CcdA [Chloroflexota bacterium]
MRKTALRTLLLTVIVLGWVASIAQAQEPVVNMFLFYSTDCPHCHEIIDNFLPEVKKQFGDQVEIKMLEIGEDADNYRLMIALEKEFGVPEEEAAIPEIFVGDRVLIGEIEIREQLVEIIQQYLGDGGVDYPPTPVPAPGDKPVARFALFYGEECPHCHRIINEYLPTVVDKYDEQVEWAMLDVADADVYEALVLLGQAAQLPEEAVGAYPAIYIGGFVMVGANQIEENLEQAIDYFLARGGVDFPEWLIVQPTPALTPGATPNATPTVTGQENHPLALAYFTKAGCRECDRVAAALNALQARYPALQVEVFEIETNAALAEWLGARCGVPEDRRLLTPAVFMGQEALTGEEVTYDNLKALIDRHAETGAEASWESFDPNQQTAAENSLIERFQSFGVMAILGAGLVDGINPCAFTTVILFISYLALTKREGWEIIATGVAFTLGVFIVYVAVGLGLFKVLETVPFFHGAMSVLRTVIFILTGVLCLVLAVASFQDFRRARKGDTKEMSLQLPHRLRLQINRVIRTGARRRAFISAAFVTGLLVSLIELACTGQVYWPTIVFVMQVPELRTRAVSYLLLYNLAFILPLVVVFVLAYLGMTTAERLGHFLRRWMWAIKLTTAMFFLTIAALVLYFSITPMLDLVGGLA